MVAPLIAAAAISAGASALGGWMSNSSNQSTNEANIAAQQAANRQNQAFAEKQFQQNAALQKEFAQSGIQWKVSDAEKAGIHPLYALGANTVSYAPSTVGGTASAAMSQPNNFDFVREAGQNIGRAIDATRSTPAQTLALQATATQIEGLQLDNELKKTQLASAMALVNQQGSHPGLPSFSDALVMPGQGDGGVVTTMPPGHEANAPKYTTPDLAFENLRWKRAPGTSDAQSWEDVYGDESILPFLINNYKGIRDIWYNTSPAYQRHVLDKLRR